MVSTSTVASLGSLLGDPARVNMMIALFDGRSMTAGELASAAGISAQTASNHLSKLVGAGLLRVQQQGRHRYHRIASDEVARLIEQMHVTGAALAQVRPRIGSKEEAMRELRSCYDHLAGRIAVEVSKVLIDCDAPIGVVSLKEGAPAILGRIGIDTEQLANGHRPSCRACLDWSERRPHVAGAVGAALLRRTGELGWIKRRESGRSLVLTAIGEKALWTIFGVKAVRSRGA